MVLEVPDNNPILFTSFVRVYTKCSFLISGRLRPHPLLLLALLHVFGRASAHSSGAPESQCSYMSPKHSYQPQESRPYAAIGLGARGNKVCSGKQVGEFFFNGNKLFSTKKQFPAATEEETECLERKRRTEVQ